MQQENLELVRSTFEAICDRDYRRAEAGFDDDAVWHNTREFPGPTTCVGPRAITKFWETLMESFDGETNVERIVEGEDVVALAAHTVGRASASGAPVDVRWGIACRVASGKISRVDVYGDWAKAVNAVASEG